MEKLEGKAAGQQIEKSEIDRQHSLWRAIFSPLLEYLLTSQHFKPWGKICSLLHTNFKAESEVNIYLPTHCPQTVLCPRMSLGLQEVLQQPQAVYQFPSYSLESL